MAVMSQVLQQQQKEVYEGLHASPDQCYGVSVRSSSCVPPQQGGMYDGILTAAARRSLCVPLEDIDAHLSNHTCRPSKDEKIESVPTVFRYKGTYFRQNTEETASQLDSERKGAWLQIVAHQDDDLLFMNPSLLRAVRMGRDIVTVYLTAGDAGRPEYYWRGREAGVRAAYSQMADVEDAWIFDQQQLNGVCMDRHRLRDCPRISLLFCQLPDAGTVRNPCGNPEENLRRLWKGDVERVRPKAAKVAVSSDALINSLATLIQLHRPARLNLLDCTDQYGDDHNDHHDSALFGLAAAERCGMELDVALHRGYNIVDLPQNLEMRDVEEQESIFITYLQHDEALWPDGECKVRSWYSAWLARDIAPLIGTVKPMQRVSYAPTPPHPHPTSNFLAVKW